MFDDLTWVEMLTRAAVAAVVGGLIGWDREVRHKAAGLRTMMLVSLGAAGTMMAGIELVANTDPDAALVGFDPMRVISGIIGGIGFLGAGAIIQSRGSVRGMTTAATIWAAASIGIACGLGLFELVAVLAGFVLVTLVVVSALKGSVLPEGNAEDEEEEGQGGSPSERG